MTSTVSPVSTPRSRLKVLTPRRGRDGTDHTPLDPLHHPPADLPQLAQLGRREDVSGALKIAPILVPLAASGLVLLMIGAAITHARRNESQPISINVVLLVLALVVAWGRFGPYSIAS